MTDQIAVNYDIRGPDLDVSTKCAILNIVWDSNFTTRSFSQDEFIGASYLRYYGEQCRNALHTQCFDGFITTHGDILSIIQQLKDINTTRAQLKNDLRNLRPQDSEVLLWESIDLAVRLWLMIDIGELKHGFVPGQKSLLWQHGPLKDVLERRFSTPPDISMRVVRVKLDRIFNARNLERIAGLQIIWTDNISDHLRLMVDDTRIAIYHHASSLEHHKDNPIFPPGFIEETLRTLSLLLPQYDKQSCKWFKAQQMKHGLDPRASATGHLTTEERQIENFSFWHDRLGILKRVFDEAEPSTIVQWWCDRRRRVQWYTFWVAATVL